MPTAHPRRIIIVASIIGGLAILAIIAVTVLPRLASSGGAGRLLMQAQGQIVTHDYDSVKAVPTNQTPGWLPAGVTNVSVEVPGAHSKIGHPVEVDATLAGSSPRSSASCTPAKHSFPWDSAAWPSVNINAATLVSCGGWTETVVDGHLYAWRFKS